MGVAVPFVLTLSADGGELVVEAEGALAGDRGRAGAVVVRGRTPEDRDVEGAGSSGCRARIAAELDGHRDAGRDGELDLGGEPAVVVVASEGAARRAGAGVSGQLGIVGPAGTQGDDGGAADVRGPVVPDVVDDRGVAELVADAFALSFRSRARAEVAVGEGTLTTNRLRARAVIVRDRRGDVD